MTVTDQVEALEAKVVAFEESMKTSMEHFQHTLLQEMSKMLVHRAHTDRNKVPMDAEAETVKVCLLGVVEETYYRETPEKGKSIAFTSEQDTQTFCQFENVRQARREWIRQSFQ